MLAVPVKPMPGNTVACIVRWFGHLKHRNPPAEKVNAMIKFLLEPDVVAMLTFTPEYRCVIRQRLTFAVCPAA